MRNILGSFLRLYARPEASTRLLFATLSGERHEIGTLGAAMLAASSGLGVAYLGPDLPAREIVDEREARRRTGAGAGPDRDLGGQSEGARTSHDRPRSPEGGRAVGGRTRRRASHRTHQPARTGPSRLQRLPTGARPHRRTGGGVTPMTMPRPVAPCAFMRVMCSHGRHRVDALRRVRGGTGHHRSGRHQRRGGERGRPAGRRRARVRPRHRVVCHQRRPRRLSYRRAACGRLSPRDPAARGPAVHQRSGGRARRAGRHGGHHAAQGGERPANGHRDRAGLPGSPRR